MARTFGYRVVLPNGLYTRAADGIVLDMSVRSALAMGYPPEEIEVVVEAVIVLEGLDDPT